MFKKFYNIKEIKDLCPAALDKRHRPTVLDKSPPSRDKKGRFVKTESNGNGPSKANTVGPLKSNGVGLSESNGIGQEEVSLNNNHRTKIIEQREKEIYPLILSSNDGKEKEVVTEIVRLKGERWIRDYLKRCGRNPNLIDELK